MLKRYLPTKWIGGKTIGTADVMNNIEDGINDVNDDICESSSSGDLLNENVNSFKVGTGTIDGEIKDFSNQMEQSLITLDNIQGKTVKEGTILKDITINIDDANYCTLRSLPNGVCDEIKDGNFIQRVGYINSKDLACCKIEYPGYWVGNNTKVFLINVPDMIFSKNATVVCVNNPLFPSLSDNEIIVIENCDYTSIAGRVNINQIMFRVTKDIDSIDAFKSYLNNIYDGEFYIIYELAKPIVTPINVSILTNSNDTINIDTPVPLSCTHKVSLNTKSQVEELQDVVQKEKKSVWQKIRELTDVKFKIGQIGYIKFPSIFGGLLIQWGRTDVRFENERDKGCIVTFPISFPNDIFFQVANMYSNNIESYKYNTNVTYNSLSQSNIRTRYIDGTSSTGTPNLYWIAIGH